MPDWQVLVVEDDPDGQEVVGRILRHHHIESDVVATAEEALGLLAERPYACVILDLALPTMDGWTLFQTIRSLPDAGTTPCIAVTGFHSVEVARKAIQAGFAAYFSKPIEPASFAQQLAHLLV